MTPELADLRQAVQAAGGRLLFVGGYVRDRLLGLASKDIDIEVYGLAADALIEVLVPFGWTDTVGASFGVIKLRTADDTYDFSLPRRENKQGQGHRGFIVEADPSMTPQEAASRRDYTINALALTPDGELLDYFNGQQDLLDKRLRHVSEQFAEDPLRVLRGMQFAGRFDLTMAPETLGLAKQLKGEYTSLSGERVWTEWHKWASKSVVPSRGLEVLRQTGWLEFYPELAALVGVPQDPHWHPEGDVWQHTLFVTNAAATVATREGLDGDARATLVLAALCHDLGKTVTTHRKNGRWRSPGHAASGVALSESFLKRIHAPQAFLRTLPPLVNDHMVHLNALSPRAVKRLALRLKPSTIDTLYLLIEADHSGRPPLPAGAPESAVEMLELAQTLDLQQDAPRPLLRGRHLIELAQAGKLPDEYKRGGKHFSELLDQVFEAQLDDQLHTVAEAKAFAVSLI